jgi:hypothetical protein
MDNADSPLNLRRFVPSPRDLSKADIAERDGHVRFVRTLGRALSVPAANTVRQSKQCWATIRPPCGSHSLSLLRTPKAFFCHCSAIVVANKHCKRAVRKSNGLDL